MWKDLDMNLQLKLIKGGLTEAMILYNTPDFDSNKKMVKFMDGKLRSKEAFYTAGYHPDFVDCKYFWRTTWYYDHHLIVLLICIYHTVCLRVVVACKNLVMVKIRLFEVKIGRTLAENSLVI